VYYCFAGKQPPRLLHRDHRLGTLSDEGIGASAGRYHEDRHRRQGISLTHVIAVEEALVSLIPASSSSSTAYDSNVVPFDPPTHLLTSHISGRM
jgi:hypothetical protein